MMLGGYEIQPVLLYLPDTEKWRNRAAEGEAHFNSVGITDILKVGGIYGEGFGIVGTHLYEYDNPGGGHQIGVANTAWSTAAITARGAMPPTGIGTRNSHKREI